MNYDEDCDALKAAMDGLGTNEKAIIQIVAGKTPQQIETLKAKYEEISCVLRLLETFWGGFQMFLKGFSRVFQAFLRF